MSNLCVITLIVAYMAFSEATVFSQKYTLKIEFNDKKSNDELLGEQDSFSLTECAAMCQGECSFYGFHPQMKKCRTHKKVFKSGVSNEGGWRYYSHHSQDSIPLDCKDLHRGNGSISGVYDIYPYRTISIPVTVYCDMKTMGGGWTTIQKRVDGSVSFDRYWTEYKNGFGAPEQDYWIGNDVIHLLTKRKNSSLYVSITLQDGSTLYEMYDGFSVSNETEKYQLFLAGPATGTLGDSMLNTGYPDKNQAGMYFSTPDRDNDRYSGNCAAKYGGGWWFNACHHAFLNGPWYPANWTAPWYLKARNGSSVRGTTMMIKRH